MAPKKEKKRLGKKHRQASTRPKLGRSAPKGGAVTGAVSPKKRKELAAKKAAALVEAKKPTKSPDRERKIVIRDRGEAGSRGHGSETAGLSAAGQKRASGRDDKAEEIHEERAWREAELLAVRQALFAERMEEARDRRETTRLPLVAICGRPNVGKSTLFNRLTETRRSIVGDEPGITRDRIYGEVEWAGRDVRLVDTGGVIPDDEALIPAEIFRQAKVGLEEADAIIMVVDGRTELAAPDVELARLLLRGGKPVFLAVNKMDSPEMFAAAENFRRLGFKNVCPISAEHGVGIGDLLDDVWAALPPEFVAEEPDEVMEGFDEEFEEDMDGGGDPLPGAQDGDEAAAPGRRLRSHGEHISRETKIAIIGRPNVGKSTLLNALTGTDRAIVSPIAGTTRDAVDEVVERDGHKFRFIDTAGIRRKGKTKLMAEKLSVIMSRKHLEAADVSLLVIDATEGVAAADANIGGYAHESGRSVIIVVNKWDLMTEVDAEGRRVFDGGPPADKKLYEQQVRDSLKYLDYAPLLFVSAAESKGIGEVFKKVELVSRERRKRVSTGAMNRFLDKIDFQRASVPMNRRVKIYYMTQAAVAPPTFVLFTDRDVKLHFSYERFLANEIRDTFKFIGSPIWFKVKARNKKKAE
ncbi:ribosome biogenesis GTPase Der [Granulicella sp. 5B5]|uniref:ribosome biogenesis GTPase Der n=1 Tax=Granulicella sp. 5B5 TaxID=1617967 RepID=UPI0015F58F33|nr:ribosome biogenesis GTPase Der [Granulicella sp. 5B5]QMV19298.1 ribosome biogenesis GTPase Der [Granulicella sp. 5B5]